MVQTELGRVQSFARAQGSTTADNCRPGLQRRWAPHVAQPHGHDAGQPGDAQDVVHEHGHARVIAEARDLEKHGERVSITNTP